MYTLSLEIINKCNLNCSYCYLGEKKNTFMSIETAEKAVELAIYEARKQYDKTLLIYFIGGEPLMAFPLICDVVAYVTNRCMQEKLKYIFSTTINGTLLTDKIVDFFMKYEFDIKLSLDGPKEVHDLNRRDYQNQGSFLSIMDKLELLKNFERRSNKKISYAHVITRNNFWDFEKSFQFLIDMGAERIETGIDYYCAWSEDERKGLRKQISNVFALYKNQVQREKKQISWNFLEHYMEMYLTKCDFYACKAGLKSMFVTGNGKIYTCAELPEFQIGNIKEGLDVKKIREIVNIKEHFSDRCKKCGYIDRCKTRGCQVSNYEIHKDIYEPVEVKCEVTKVFFQLIENNFNIQQIMHIEGKEDKV